jgi:acyl dehydratase
MPIRYPDVLDLREGPARVVWSERDSILYALGIGMGSDPLDARELPFVYEKGLRAIPTMATVIAFGRRPLQRSGMNYLKIVHAGQSLTFLKSLPGAGSALLESRVTHAYDKGPKGAILITETTLRDEISGELLVALENAVFARADGGFGGPTSGMAEPHAVPTRPPDRSIDMPTRLDQAALYRLCGDLNPLHIDPAVAIAAGFPRPVLHGLCTYGMACRAVLVNYADYEPSRIHAHSVRFAQPVFPGDVLTIDLWKEQEIISFEARVKSRASKVITNGKTVIGPRLSSAQAPTHTSSNAAKADTNASG